MILIDTCTFIWDALEPRKLSIKAKKAIAAASGSGIFLNEISLWEIAMLIKKKRLDAGAPYKIFMDTALAVRDFQLIGITPEIADISVNLSEQLTLDPADRIIIATAQVMNIPLITADKNIKKFSGIEVIW